MSGPAKPRSHGRLAIGASAVPRRLLAEPALAGAWHAQVLTLYPQMFPGPLGHALIGRALREGRWRLTATDIRDFATDAHRSVDDTPAGGGPGMVMRADVLGRALDHVATGKDPAAWPRLALSPRGRPFTQTEARRLAAAAGVILVCGRFEGIDQRVLDARGLDEVSIGDFVLTGGETAAMVLIEACVRLIPRVLGNSASVVEESFSAGLLEHPHYTRPQSWEEHAIPGVLLSGHHARIAQWRRAQAEALTQERRPDLWRIHRATGQGSKREPELSDAKHTAPEGGHQKEDGS
ncbi:MAG: tRNA (guanosine(37)-N1)-methyltransferase TrmD [Pseudomonadota bacterium]